MKNKRLAEAFDGIEEKYVLDAAPPEKNGRRRVWHRLVAFAACLCLLTVGTFSAYAFSEDIRSFINMGFFKNNLRITEENIPEGYTPIYDAEGLDAIRNDLKGNYILMKDIRFTDADFAEGGRFAGGWEPIGDASAGYRGIFNGNGYVVYGLQVDTDKNYAGLFGCVEVKANTNQGGMIINLGVSGARITANAGEWNECYVGVIAGSAEIIAGCYVDNSEVLASFSSYGESAYAHVGGLCGDVYIADSCYVNAKVSYKEYPFDIDNAKLCPTAYVGAFAGSSFGVINSLCLGEAEYVGDPFGEVIISDMVANMYLLPRLLNGPSYLALMDKFGTREIDKMPFRQKQFVFKYVSDFMLYPEKYILYTPDYELLEKTRAAYDDLLVYSEAYDRGELTDEIIQKRTEVFEWFEGLPEEDCWFRLTSDLVTKEKDLMMAILRDAVSEEELAALLFENGMKVGIIDCYTSRQGEYTGFDMEKIWRNDKSGIPKLRIFD